MANPRQKWFWDKKFR